MAKNNLDKLLAQKNPNAEYPQDDGWVWDGMDADEKETWFDVRTTQGGVEDASAGRRAVPVAMAHVVRVEVIDDEVVVGDPRWVWDSTDNDGLSSPVVYHGPHGTTWNGERPERVISQDAEKVYELWLNEDDPSVIAKELGWSVSRVEAIMAKELNQ